MYTYCKQWLSQTDTQQFKYHCRTDGYHKVPFIPSADKVCLYFLVAFQLPHTIPNSFRTIILRNECFHFILFSSIEKINSLLIESNEI